MNSRRSFFKQLLMGGAAFAILPPALTYVRLWKAQRQMVLPPHIELITSRDFAAYLNSQVPIFDELILKSHRDYPVLHGRWKFVDYSDSRIINPCESSG